MVKLGVLGISGHFLKRVLPAIKDSNIVQLNALASRDSDKLKRFASELKNIKTYGSYDELLNDKEIDFVYIPLPNHLHLEWIEKSAKKGKHILCEKPLGLNSTEVSKIIKIASEYKVKIMEHLCINFTHSG